MVTMGLLANRNNLLVITDERLILSTNVPASSRRSIIPLANLFSPGLESHGESLILDLWSMSSTERQDVQTRSINHTNFTAKTQGIRLLPSSTQTDLL